MHGCHPGIGRSQLELVFALEMVLVLKIMVAAESGRSLVGARRSFTVM